MTHHFTILGCGTMGRAILGGVLGSQAASAWRFSATVHSQSALHSAREAWPQVSFGLDNLEAAKQADIVLIAVKPQNVKTVLGKPEMAAALAGKLLVSICAGVTLAQLRSYAPEARVIRVMSNTPALVREAMSVISPHESATAQDVADCTAIFAAIGRCIVLDEKYLDTVTGLAGSGPAFVCVILESLADGGVMMGLPRKVAVELAAQTLLGTARMVLETGVHPAALRDQVTTPAGCTIAGLFRMEEGRIRSTVARTVQDAALVAAGLGADDVKTR